MTSQLERLARPFPPKYVKPPSKGKFGSYVPHDVVQQALLAILGPVDIRIGQVFFGDDGKVEGCLVTLEAHVDGHFVSVTEIGDCEIPTNWKTQGARMKDCISDGVKRCAMRLGLGLHLWAQEDYFLYDQLRSDENAGAGGSAEAVPSAEVPPVSATSPVRPDVEHLGPGDGGEQDAPRPVPLPASPNRVQQLQAKLSAMIADGISGVTAERQKRGLPKLDENCTLDELDAWRLLLNDMDQNLNRALV